MGLYQFAEECNREKRIQGERFLHNQRVTGIEVDFYFSKVINEYNHSPKLRRR